MQVATPSKCDQFCLVMYTWRGSGLGLLPYQKLTIAGTWSLIVRHVPLLVFLENFPLVIYISSGLSLHTHTHTPAPLVLHGEAP